VRFELAAAGPRDEAEIRALVSSSVMLGSVASSFCREPDYFLGCHAMGDPCRTLLARESEGGRLVAMGCRALSTRWVNGREARVAYYGLFRIDPRYRGRWIPALAAPAFRALAAADPADLAFCAIADDNGPALSAFAGRPRRGFPALERLFGVTTMSLIPTRFAPARPRRGLSVERGSRATLPGMVDFLSSEGRARQFFPVLTEASFSPGGSLSDLEPEDFIVVRAGAETRGILAIWDQGAYKQTVIRGYGGLVGAAKGIVDLGLRAAGARPLPAAGWILRSAFAFGLIARDVAAFDALLGPALEEARSRGLDALMVGFAEGDPLLRSAGRRLGLPYGSAVFRVAEEGAPPPALDRRPCHVEGAML
jgi:hypothetical protein